MSEIKGKPVKLKNMKDLENPYQLVMDEIKTKSRLISGWKRADELNMFSHFVELLGEKSFNDHVLRVASWLGGGGSSFDKFFFSLHKSMRQTDFYDDFGDKSGHIDMLLWGFIQIFEIPFEVLKSSLAKK